MSEFGNGPVLRKRATVLHPFGKFENGPQSGSVTKQRIAGIVANFTKYPRQVPIFMLVDHPKTNDEQPPVGWVESATQDKDGNLVVDLKLHGPGAAAVGGDLIRGASVYTVRAKATDGSPIGEVLKHVLLTNEPFDTEVNLAASRLGGAEAATLSFTATLKEADMAEENKNADPPADDDLALKVQTLEAKVKEQMAQNIELAAANSNLLADVERLQSYPGLKEAGEQILALKRENRANEIRRKVKDGVHEGRFDRALVGEAKLGYDHPSNEGVLLWFKTSIFKDSIDKLDFALSTFPAKTMNRQFNSGAPAEGGTLTLTQEESAQVRALGMTAEDLQIANSAEHSEDYKRRMAERKAS